MSDANERRQILTHPVIWLAPAGLLLAALLPLPYGFYTLLRLVVSAAAAYLAYREYEVDRSLSIWVMVFVGILLLFNPLVPVHLSKEVWVPIDIGTSVLFMLHWLLRR